MSLKELVNELQTIFPYIDAETIKTVLCDCDYDKDACAEVLLCAQEDGNIDSYENAYRTNHHDDVTIVYKDHIITVNKEDMPKNPFQDPFKPKTTTMNETYKKMAEEDEQDLKEGRIQSVQEIMEEEKKEEVAYEKKKKNHTKAKGTKKENEQLLDDTD